MRSLSIVFAVAAAAAHVCVQASAPAPRSGVGMNLDQPKYWQSDWPFINELKRAAGWSPRCASWATPGTCKDFAPGASGNDTREHDKVAWDENGYPRRLPAADDPTVKYRKLSALMFQGNGGSHPAGRYVVLYDGEGEMTYEGAGRRIDAESRPGRDVLAVTNTPGVGLTLSITRTNEANHLRNIRLIGPGGVCASAPRTWVHDAGRCTSATYRSLEELSATQTFHPAYVGDLSGFRALRFMKWSSPNTSKIVHWSQRPLLTAAMWSTEEGVPYEAMFELAGVTGADPWINVPLYVDDEFVRRLAQLAKRSMAPGASLYFEYGNEPWNQAPPYSLAGVMFDGEVKAKWPGAAMPVWQQRLNWYAYRSVQMCRIVKQEFGPEASRVRCVANSQAANSEVATTILACELAKEELGQPCGKAFDALAIAPYFGYQIGSNEFAATVDRWVDEPDGGLANVFLEITGRNAQGRQATPTLHRPGTAAPAAGGLVQTKSWVAANKQVADRFGLPLIAYEGGQHLQTYRGGRTEAMLRAANRDPRMGAALSTLIEDWKAAGGQLFVAFVYTHQAVGAYWGMKEYQLDEAAPKWQAIKALRDQPCWWEKCRQ